MHIHIETSDKIHTYLYVNQLNFNTQIKVFMSRVGRERIYVVILEHFMIVQV